jgi:hypothetical protein
MKWSTISFEGGNCMNTLYTVVKEDEERMHRRRVRANELGIKLFLLDDEEDTPDELQELEDYIVDNYIDMDIDVPEEIKKKYLYLKTKTNR